MGQDFATDIRTRRIELGLTQAEVAEQVGRATSTIRAWESGRSRPADTGTLRSLQQLLGISMADEPAPDHAARVLVAPPVGGVVPEPVAAPVPQEMVVAVPSGGSVTSVNVTPIRTDVDPMYRARALITAAGVILCLLVAAWAFGRFRVEAAAMLDALFGQFR